MVTTASPALFDLLAQIPLAGIVVAVIVIFLRYLEKSDERQRQFIADQRNEHAQALAGITDAMHSLTTELSAMRLDHTEHHTYTEQSIQTMQSIIGQRRAGDTSATQKR